MNRIVLVGRLAADPEMRYTPAGTAVTNLRIAVRDPFRKDDQGRPESDFFDVTCWRERAEYAGQYLAKGILIALHGRLCVDQWVDQDGNKRRKYFVTADQIESWGKPDGQLASPGAVDLGSAVAEADPEEYNDPFAPE